MQQSYPHTGKIQVIHTNDLPETRIGTYYRYGVNKDNNADTKVSQKETGRGIKKGKDDARTIYN